jgi:hypothetical protein
LRSLKMELYMSLTPAVTVLLGAMWCQCFRQVARRRRSLVLTRFRGHFRSYSEGVHYGKTTHVPAGVPA